MSEQRTAGAAAAGPEPAAAAASRRRRGGGSALDMVRSLALVLLPVAVIALVAPWPGGEDVASVDVADVAEQLSPGAGYPLPVPRLPEQWRATDARFDASGPAGAATWHVGYVTPQGRYAGLDVTRDPAAGAGWAEQVTRAGAAAGEREVAGVTWRVTERPAAGRRALDGRLADGTRVAVEGDAEADALATLLSATLAELRRG